MDKIKNRLNKLSNGKKSKWSNDADFRLKNRKWLRYSSNIARRVLAAIEDDDKMNQKNLAEKINVTPQYVSRLLQGHQNLTLETIAKLSEALNVELISFPDYKYNTASPIVHTGYQIFGNESFYEIDQLPVRTSFEFNPENIVIRRPTTEGRAVYQKTENYQVESYYPLSKVG
jgi:transcriptional regulator with XRE-family HTH domain